MPENILKDITSKLNKAERLLVFFLVNEELYYGMHASEKDVVEMFRALIKDRLELLPKFQAALKDIANEQDE